MGTRHLVCIYHKGRFVVAQYGHWDGYPSATGVWVYNFIMVAGNIDRLKAGLAHVNAFDSGEEFGRAVAVDKSTGPLKEDRGAEILEVVASADSQDPIAVIRELAFAQDSLFCEWIYVLDLDGDLLEVYGGYSNSTEEAETRFAEIGGVTLGLVKSFKFSELPQSEADFVDILEPKES